MSSVQFALGPKTTMYGGSPGLGAPGGSPVVDMAPVVPRSGSLEVSAEYDSRWLAENSGDGGIIALNYSVVLYA